MKVALPGFERTRVMVVNDVMLDRCWYGPTSHISPEAPVPVVKVDIIEERPGGVANVVVNIASLGTNSRLVGLTGIDDAARALNKMLTDVNVKCNFTSVPTHPTIIKLRMLSRNQQLICLDFEEGFEDIDLQPLCECANQALGSIGALVLSDYAKGALASVQQMIALARKVEMPVLIGPKETDFERYRGITLLTPSLSESEAVADKCKGEDELVKRGMKVVAGFDLLALLIMRSEQGTTLLQSGKSPLHTPTQAREVYDVTNIGDTVIGVLAATPAAGNSLEEACYFANAIVGAVVGKLGISTVSPIELESTVRGRADTDFGVMSESELKQAVTSVRKRSEKVVMTNGVFDIPHTGRVPHLANARKLGDRLVAVVNNDASTKRLKDETRPVNLLEQCMIILDALESVDWAVSFEEDTPQRLIASALSGLLVKGGDYKPEQIAGSEEVWTSDGGTLMLNFEDGCSTTNITNKIQKSSDK